MTRDDAPSGACCLDSSVRTTLEQARVALDAAVASVTGDPQAACDDILAARLLVNTVLLKMDGHAG